MKIVKNLFITTVACGDPFSTKVIVLILNFTKIICLAIVLSASGSALLYAKEPVQERIRARDLGIPFEGVTGRWNAITIQATEEAVINSLVAAETMEGINGNTFYAIPHHQLKKVLRKYNRLVR